MGAFGLCERGLSYRRTDGGQKSLILKVSSKTSKAGPRPILGVKNEFEHNFNPIHTYIGQNFEIQILAEIDM